MKANKSVIKFLLKFFLVYFVLTGGYSLYLKKTQVKGDFFSCSPITEVVAKQSKMLIEFLGYQSKTFQNTHQLSMALEVNEKYVAIVVEGCTAMSIMILFLAFIVAFSGKLKHTLIFGVVGLVSIYIINIFRIAIMSILLYEFPEYQKILHDLVFPAIIYGYVFLLWVIWVKWFALRTKNE